MIRRPPRSTLSSSSAASDVYKRQRLYESENIVDEQKDVFAFDISVVFRHSQSCECYSETGSRRFVHLSENENRIFENSRFLHFEIKIVSLSRSLSNSCEH
eukprot:TRINITY_DN7081_c0_g1_i1.p3 TRINITY_DN7081_c0_g1~~TRINITY_DN7081_c0_g1_i1.p3  ORF type:complete len:101 (+),score=7.09 TRINITY_DN7081_c0_g1_i1:94-396(+)